MNTNPSTTPRREGRLLIFSAPSGSGKSTIIGRLMAADELHLAFSVSCTSREPRGQERHGVDYYFISADEFRRRIEAGEFLEYEEVYPGRFYGTLRSEVDRRLSEGQNVVLDIDVNGGLRVKDAYGDRAMAVFIQPPSIDELRKRLEGRATDAPDVIEQRLSRAAFELSQAGKFDRVVVNDSLDRAVAEAYDAVKTFIDGR